MVNNVAKKTAKTSFWTAVERFSNLGVNLIVQLLLARILCPSDFGVVAMLTVFIGISQAVSECGVTNALIRKQDCTQTDYSTGFYLNVGISISLYLILFFVAPYIAEFYKMPDVKSLLRVYSLVFIVESLRIVQYSKLCKRLEFKTIARISSSSVLISGIIGVFIAYIGGGAWALVVQVLSAATLYLVLIQLKERWLPDLSFNRESFKYLWNFGSKMLLTGIISRIYSNIYNLVIGKFFSSSILGVFNNGQKYAQFYPNLVDSILVKNSLPILSEYQDDCKKLESLYRKFVKLSCFVTFPVCVFVFVMAKPIVILLFTEKWIEAVPYLKVFAITALLIPANSINLNMLQVMGRTDYTLKAEIIKKSIGFVIVFVLIPFGPIWLAFGSSFMALIAYGVNVYYAKKVLGLSFLVQFRDLIGTFVSSLVGGIVVYLITFLIKNNVIVIVVGLIFMFGVFFILTKYVYQDKFYQQIHEFLRK